MLTLIISSVSRRDTSASLEDSIMDIGTEIAKTSIDTSPKTPGASSNTPHKKKDKPAREYHGCSRYEDFEFDKKIGEGTFG